jgi:hypothetical protein
MAKRVRLVNLSDISFSSTPEGASTPTHSGSDEEEDPVLDNLSDYNPSDEGEYL